MEEKKKNKISKILLIVLIIIQTIFYIFIGTKKEYFHMDEAFSYGLMNYDKINITDNEDFLNNWHDNSYFIDYLSVNSDEVLDFSKVYTNQKNDVHPPLFYLLLRIFSLGTIDSFSKWTGLSLNILIGIGITIYVYKISKKLFSSNWAALLVSIISAFSMAMLENMMYIRMYAFLTFTVLLYTDIFLKLYKKEKIRKRDLIILGISLILGGLTQYYFFIYVVFTYIVLIIKSIKSKDYTYLKKYTITAIISAIIYLIIFPFAIQHVFFSYRGPGEITKGLSIKELLSGIFTYLHIINKNIFNYLIIPFVILVIVVAIIKRQINKQKYEKLQDKNEDKIEEKTNNKEKIASFIIVPMILYLIIISIITPYKELRYILPICPIIIICTCYLSYILLKKYFSKKQALIIIAIFFIIIEGSVGLFNNKLDFTYEKNNNIAQRVEEKNAPILYVFNTGNNRFLDDIYLCTLAPKTYILDVNNLSEENLRKILKGQNLENGLIVICNEGFNSEEVKKELKKISGQEMEHVQRMNACDIYYLNKFTIT